jgi:hypothetical protein
MTDNIYLLFKQIFRPTDKTADVFTVSRKFREDMKNFFAPNKYCFLEVGCYRGLTAKALANHFIEYLGLDISRKSLLIARMANLFNRGARFRRFDLYNSDWSTLKFPADIVFIDANHTYECVRQDIKNCIKVYKDAFVVFDDYGAWEGVHRAVSEAINDHRLEILREIGEKKGELSSIRPNNLGPEGLICRVV